MSQSTSNWWQGTNFWVALVMAFGGISVGLSETDVREFVNYIFGGVGVAFAIREKVKASGINVKAWLSSKNTWNYLFAVAATFFPAVPPEWFSRLNEIVGAIFTKNYTALLSGLFALAVSVFYFIKDRKKAQESPVGT